jgi:cobalt-zinc-cadmium efflux system outer membrane protein
MLRVLCCACAALATAGWAQPPLALQSAVQTALEQHPLLAAGTARISSAEGLRNQAKLRPNPRAILQTENWRFRGSPEFSPGTDVDTFAYGSQLLETAGKRQRRTEVAQILVHRSELERELTAKQVAARVKAAYWNAAGTQRVYDLLLENVGTFDQIVRYHEARVREGAMAEADLLKVRVERERVAIAANSALLDVERARIQLFREMGQTTFPQVRLADSLEPLPPLPPATEDEALANRTEMKLAAASLEQAQANLRLQQSLARPDVEVLAGYKHTAGYNTVIGGVQLPIPFTNRNQGSIASASADVRVAQLEQAAMKATVLAELRAALAEASARRNQLAQMFPVILKQAEESSRISQAAYREGGTDLLRFLDTERIRIETQVLYFRTLAEYRQSLAALDAALGVAP